MTDTMTAEDALKYAAAIVRERVEWTTDEIGGALCDNGHDIPIEALCDLVDDIVDLTKLFGDPNRYSDGRRVKTSKEIQLGLVTSHVWHPAVEQAHSWRGTLPSDPGEPAPGIYEVTTEPATQDIHVRVVRTA